MSSDGVDACRPCRGERGCSMWRCPWTCPVRGGEQGRWGGTANRGVGLGRWRSWWLEDAVQRVDAEGLELERFQVGYKLKDTNSHHTHTSCPRWSDSPTQ